MAHILDLEVLPAGEHQLSPVVIFSQVPGAVDALGVIGIQWVLDKMGAVLFRAAIIAQSQGSTTDADLSLGVRGRDQAVFPIQQEHILIGEGNADGNAGGIVPVLFQNVIGAVAGDLRGPVEIYITRIRQMLAKFLQGPQGHDLAGEEDLLQAFRRFVVQGMEACDEAQGGYGPDQGRGLLLAEKIHELHRG